MAKLTIAQIRELYNKKLDQNAVKAQQATVGTSGPVTVGVPTVVTSKSTNDAPKTPTSATATPSRYTPTQYGNTTTYAPDTSYPAAQQKGNSTTSGLVSSIVQAALDAAKAAVQGGGKASGKNTMPGTAPYSFLPATNAGMGGMTGGTSGKSAEASKPTRAEVNASDPHSALFWSDEKTNDYVSNQAIRATQNELSRDPNFANLTPTQQQAAFTDSYYDKMVKDAQTRAQATSYTVDPQPLQFQLPTDESAGAFLNAQPRSLNEAIKPGSEETAQQRLAEQEHTKAADNLLALQNAQTQAARQFENEELAAAFPETWNRINGIGEIPKSELDRYLELAQKDAFTDAEKKEAKDAAWKLSHEIGAKNNQLFSMTDAERDEWYSTRAVLDQINLALNNKAGNYSAGEGFLFSFPFAEKAVNSMNENAQQVMRDMDTPLMKDTAGYADMFNENYYETAKTTNPAGYTVGNIAGSLAQMFGVSSAAGGISKAATGALSEIGLSAKAAPFVEKAIGSLVQAGYVTGKDTTMPGYDVENLGADFLKNFATFGTMGIAGGAVGSATKGLAGIPGAIARVGAQASVGAGASALGNAVSYPLYGDDSKPTMESIGMDMLTMAIFNAVPQVAQELRTGLVSNATSKPKSEYFSKIKSADELKAEYRTLAKRYHPDKGGEPEIFTQINNEYGAMLEYLKNNPATGGNGNIFTRAVEKIRSWIDGLKKGNQTPQTQEMTLLLENTLESAGVNPNLPAVVAAPSQANIGATDAQNNPVIVDAVQERLTQQYMEQGVPTMNAEAMAAWDVVEAQTPVRTTQDDAQGGFDVQADVSPAVAWIPETGGNDVVMPSRRDAGMMEVSDPGNRARYEMEIDGVFDGSFSPRSEIILGRTPETLMLYGAPDLPLHMTQTTARKIAYPDGYYGGKHNLGVQTLKELPDQLADPVAILENKSHPNNSVVVITEWLDVDGNRVIVPVEFNKQGAITVNNKINTAFGRDDMSQYLGENNTNVIYTRNEKDISELLSHGRQLPWATRSDDVLVGTADSASSKTGLGKNLLPGNAVPFPNIIIPQDGRGVNNDAENSPPANVNNSGNIDTVENENRDDLADTLFGDEAIRDLLGDINTAEQEKIDKMLADAYQRKLGAEEWTDIADKKALLTPEQIEVAEQIARGMNPDNFRDGMVTNAVIDYANARETVIEAGKKLERFQELRRIELFDEAEAITKNSHLWKDKKWGLLYQRETQERNIEDIAKNDPGGAGAVIKTYFEPVHTHEADGQRFIRDYRDRIKAMELSAAESVLVQAYGEEMINDSQLSEYAGRNSALDVKNKDGELVYSRRFRGKNGLVDPDKVKQATAEFRAIYDEILTEANKTLRRSGYEPVSRRGNYFPHFSTGKGIKDTVVSMFGVDPTSPDRIPEDIAGLTHTFRPGKKFFANFLQRHGDATDLDALEGFDRYIAGVKDVIYHTEDIQKLRALETVLRTKHTPAKLKKQIKEIYSSNLSDAEKESKIRAVQGGKVPNYVVNLSDYIDVISGKKAFGDRNMERKINRNIYNVMRAMEGRVASNMVGYNPSVALSNFISGVLAHGQIGTRHMLRATYDTIRSWRKSDGFANDSDFLTARRGSGRLSKTGVQKFMDAGAVMFEFTDNFMSEVITRAAYLEELSKGATREEALRAANRKAANILADRSYGAMPTLFNEKNPITKLLTMFQLEVNNQYSNLFKDMPREAKERGKLWLALGLLKYMLGAFLFNTLVEKITGRRPALDPVGILIETVEDFSNPDMKKSEAAGNLASRVLEQAPFVGGLLGGGRVPISSALPFAGNPVDIAKNVGMLADDDVSAEMKREIWLKELAKLGYYVVPPSGGGQAKKTIEGAAALLEGGDYAHDADGNQKLKFATDATAWDVVRGLMFGKYATEGGKGYVDGNFRGLSISQTNAHTALVEAGMKPEAAFKVVQMIAGIEPDADSEGNTVAGSKKKKQMEAIQSADMTDDQKYSLYESMIFSEDERDDMQMAVDDFGISKADVMAAYRGTYGIEGDKDSEGKTITNTAGLKKKDVIDALNLDEDQSQYLYEVLGVGKKVAGGEVTWDSIAGNSKAAETGMNGSAPVTVINDAKGYDVPKYKAETLEKIGSMGISAEDYAYIDDRIKAYVDKVEYLEGLGFNDEQLRGLVSNFVMGETAHNKMTVAADMGIDNDTYIDAYIFGYSSIGSKAQRNAQIWEYVDDLAGLTEKQKDALYEWIKVSKGKAGAGEGETDSSDTSGGSGRRRGRSGGGSSKAKKAATVSVPKSSIPNSKGKTPNAGSGYSKKTYGSGGGAVPKFDMSGFISGKYKTGNNAISEKDTIREDAERIGREMMKRAFESKTGRR